MPQNSAPNRNRQLVTTSRTMLPRKGTSNTNTPHHHAHHDVHHPNREKASIFPSTSSVGRSGVDSNCSIVPISHSRAMVIDVSSDAMIIRITAIRPGTT